MTLAPLSQCAMPSASPLPSLSQVLDVLLIILFALSTILIYSLLLGNAESRTFELAVRRMLGSRRTAIVLLLMTQAGAYGLPSWICGLVMGQLLVAGLLAFFSAASSIPIPLLLSPAAIGAATVLALAIPAVSAIGPIRSALRATIRDALDSDRPKATAVKFELVRADDGRISVPTVIVGGVGAALGFALYYLLPLALLTLNLSLFFNVSALCTLLTRRWRPTQRTNAHATLPTPSPSHLPSRLQLFLAIILGMLAGLILLALNLELLLLRLCLWLTIAWWEHTAVVSILWSNLSAGHRSRNRKTVIMYALSIAFIVFITVAASAQIQSATFTAQSRQGAPLTFGGIGPNLPMDPALAARVDNATYRWGQSGLLQAAAWTSVRLDTATAWLASATSSASALIAAAVASTSGGGSGGNGTGAGAGGGAFITGVYLRDVGRTTRWTVAHRGIGPRFYGKAASDSLVTGTAAVGASATYNDFLTVEAGAPASANALPLSQQLYTAAGSSSVLVSNSMSLEVYAALGADLTVQSAGTLGAATGRDASGGALAVTSGQLYSRTRHGVSALVSGSPGFRFTRGPSAADNSLLSLAGVATLVDAHISEAPAALQRVAPASAVAAWVSQLRAASAAMAAAQVRLAGSTVAARASVLVATLARVAATTIAARSQVPQDTAARPALGLTGNVSTNATWSRLLASDTSMLAAVYGDGLGAAASDGEATALRRAMAAVWQGCMLLEMAAPRGIAVPAVLSGLVGTGTVDVGASVDHIVAGVSAADVPLYRLFAGTDEVSGASLSAAAKAQRTEYKAALSRAQRDVAAARRSDGFEAGSLPSTEDNEGTWSTADLSDVADDLGTTVLLLELFFAVLAVVAMVSLRVCGAVAASGAARVVRCGGSGRGRGSACGAMVCDPVRPGTRGGVSCTRPSLATRCRCSASSRCWPAWSPTSQSSSVRSACCWPSGCSPTTWCGSMCTKPSSSSSHPRCWA